MVQPPQVNQHNNINELKDKSQHDYLNRCRKCLWQNPTCHHHKSAGESTTGGNIFNIIKVINDKPTSSIFLSVEENEGILLKSQ